MFKKIFDSVIVLALAVMSVSCAKTNEVPDFTQPSIVVDATKGTVDGVAVGPDRDYEQESTVTYMVTVKSSKRLSRLMVSTSADAFDQSSRVIKTIPDRVLDNEGNFSVGVNDVTVFYEYRIHGSIAPKTTETLTFTVMDESNNTGFISATHQVIKKGSTQGKILRTIDMPYTNEAKGLAIGSLDNMMYSLETDGNMNPDRAINDQRGPFFSLTHAIDVNFGVDAINMADDIDFIGYRVISGTIYANYLPSSVSNNGYYLVSPSDSTMLLSAYPGAIHRMRVFGNGGQSGTVKVTWGGLVREMTFVNNNLGNVVPEFVSTYGTDYNAIGAEIYAEGQRGGFRLMTKPGGTIEEGRFELYEPPVFEIVTGNLSVVILDTRDFMKVNAMRRTMREFYQKYSAEERKVKVVKFLRMDNLPAAKRVTPDYFDALTHDNEFDTLLADVETQGKERGGPMSLNQVWGFVTSDGKRGMIRTSPTTCIISTGVSANVPAPNGTNYQLYGTIKYQKN